MNNKNDSPYVYPTTESVNVPSHRSTDLAFNSLFEAKRIRDERENTMDPAGPE